MAEKPFSDERLLQDLLRRLKLMRDEVEASRPAIAACDSGWDRAEELLDEAYSALGQSISLALDHWDDIAAVEAGDRRWRPDGTTEPVPE